MFHRKSTLAVLLGVIFLSFFGTLAVSAWMFPQNYDWRYRVISNLLSPRDNPGHYWLPAIGLALTALFCIWSLVTLVPLAGIFVSECLLMLTRMKPAWATPIHSALRHSVFWHLGFWEWTGAAAVFVFLCAAVFLTPQQKTHPRNSSDVMCPGDRWSPPIT